ncbi:hypothetical protein [Ferrovum myxofaciens]|jgi:hypothetical protein|uniref:hypothetical protein n=1 Tax=Ferrovum myxofaciens TaxID=416213 RepID=UPI0004E286EC|nr:hypothetical protein [Ferrovum myxofaciens]
MEDGFAVESVWIKPLRRFSREPGAERYPVDTGPCTAPLGFAVFVETALFAPYKDEKSACTKTFNACSGDVPDEWEFAELVAEEEDTAGAPDFAEPASMT